MNDPGLLALILHAHLPFVRHPEQQDFLEERWLFEAMTESYLPLLQRFQRLANDRVAFRLTMSFSPTLLAMLSDTLLQDRYLRHLDRLIELTDKEIQRTRWQPPFQRLALFYHHRLTTARRQFSDVYRRDVIRPFRELSDGGYIELMGSCATHGYLPLLDTNQAAVRAQIRLGLQLFERTFGKRPAGFWLPECGYQPGHERLLDAEGIRYFVTDAHGLLLGAPRPKYGVFAPGICPNGVAAFGRDLDTSRSVWSATEGYPGHPDYREFYRDIGHDLEYEYLRPYLNGDGARVDTGIKYYRVTGRTEVKHPYDPDRALEQAAHDASRFVARRRQQVRRLRQFMDRAPLIVSPYDTELFGHWWFEGPDWLEFVLRKPQGARRALRFVTPSEYLAEHPQHQPLAPALSSWGEGGYHDVWLNGTNDWIYRHLHTMAERMVDVATRFPAAEPLRRRALNQMARELLLTQASDWAFILKAQTHTGYAYRRLNDHIARFTRLYESVTDGAIDDAWLTDLEATDRLFPFLDYHVYAEGPTRG